MKVNGLATKGKVLDNPFGGKAVTAYCAGLAVCFFHKVTLIQPEVYLGNVLLDIYHIKIICEYLWKDTTQQLLGLHDAKITNTYEIMCMRGRGCNWVLRLTPSLPLIEEWLNDNNPNVIRAVTEGLRIWTSRPFFKENPAIAITLISKHKAHESEYLRKSVGNALRDISKKHAELIRQEVEQWDLSNPRVLFTYKFATKLLK